MTYWSNAMPIKIYKDANTLLIGVFFIGNIYSGVYIYSGVSSYIYVNDSLHYINILQVRIPPMDACDLVCMSSKARAAVGGLPVLVGSA